MIMKKKKIDQDVEFIIRARKSPIFFIKKMWGLVPQPLKEKYKDDAYKYIQNGLWDKFQPGWFKPFQKGKHITWQQWLFLLAVKRAINDQSPKRVSAKSGHGTGKSTCLSWLIPWYLFCFKNAQVPCTAPTSQQMNDVLWKELSIWLNRMPKGIRSLYDWQSGYLRMNESPETWFARALTARKENPEALAGVHGDFVMMIIDEASGVDEVIFNTAEGVLTNKNILVLMISNPTRLIGYFYDSHHSDRYNWQTLSFNSEDSPIVDPGYIKRIADKHGEDSDEYRIRVLGDFPKEDAVDKWGYVPLLTRNDLKEVPDLDFVGSKKLGIDPSGEGNDRTVWVVRDNFKAKVVATEKVSNPKSIAQKSLSLIEYYKLKPREVIIDNFGEGANVAKELALTGKDINAVNVGNKPSLKSEQAIYLNLRAKMFILLKEWLRRGGELIRHDDWKQLLTIRMIRSLQGSKIMIMSKKDMRKLLGLSSPDVADALALTFLIEDEPQKKSYKPPRYIPEKYEGKVNPRGETKSIDLNDFK